MIKFLNILKDLTLDKNFPLNSVFLNFDFIFLYNIHIKNIESQKINELVKHLIYNLTKNLEISENLYMK